MTTTIDPSAGAPPSSPAVDAGSGGLSGWERYELGPELGRGGMGVVHKARDRRLDRTVALKFIRGIDPGASMRLLQEARAQARIDHPSVCHIYEVGEVAGRAYIAMQFVDGRPLAELIPHASLHQRVTMIRDVALGLHEAHTLGVLHRDVKPANILVETAADGGLHAVVMDFGLARQEIEEQGLTETGALLGTPAYMSPEQARGEHRLLDRRSDVYSLGATLYEVLGGEPPFSADTKLKLLLRVLHEEPVSLRTRSPSVPEDLQTIVGRCMAREPERRYDSARAVADDLDRYIRGEPILGRKESFGYRLWRRSRRHRALLATAALSLVALAVVAGLAIRARVQARLASQLGTEVAELEWFLRSAYLLPVHDVSLEEGMVRQRMTEIASRAGGGPLADYAIGRGHLALHEDDEARASLDRALAGGLASAELHYARGLVLGRLYDRARAARREAGIEERYLVPALASLEKSRGGRLQSPSYLEGLIAYYRRDYAAAIELAGAARREAPWLYEATQLEADAHLARAIARRGVDRAGAVGDLDEAARLYDAALEVGRSDAGLYLGRAGVWTQRTGLSSAWSGAAPPADPPERLEEWCRRAAVIAPRSTAPLDKLGFALIELGVRRWHEGGDPGPAWRDALAAAGRALALDPRDVGGHLVWAGVRCYQADIDEAHGLDPAAEVDDCMVHARRALAVEPRNARALNVLGRASTGRGRLDVTRGVDPIPAYVEAVETFGHALAIDPAVSGFRNQLEAYAFWGQHLTASGRSPVTLAPAVELALIGCLGATQRAAYCPEMASRLYVTLARHEVDAGRDPAAPLARAEALLAAATGAAEIDKDWAILALLRRRAAPEGGVAACLARDAREPTCLAADAQEALRAGDPARARGRAAAALDADPHNGEAAALLAESERRLGHPEAGLAACARGLAIHPADPELLALRRALLAQSPSLPSSPPAP